jgi:hypothetical protein
MPAAMKAPVPLQRRDDRNLFIVGLASVMYCPHIASILGAIDSTCGFLPPRGEPRGPSGALCEAAGGGDVHMMALLLKSGARRHAVGGSKTYAK